MASIVGVRFAAFIPQPYLEHHVEESSIVIQFNGNDREFTYYTEDEPEKSKMAQHIVCDFSNQVIHHYKSTGPTTETMSDNNTGEVLREAHGHAATDGLLLTDSSISDHQATFKVIGCASNPLREEAPAIDWEYAVTVSNSGEVRVVGTQDGYPAHEIYKRVDGGTPVTIYQHDPRKTGDTPAALLPPMEYSVNKTVE
ncbi:DUF3238 domain-containing protein [Paenibacillaceae bacterium]|nr:DUF3238 domain-containing protein [Paenibacillaceae bacterium]